MASISDYLDKMVVTVSSQDGNIRARVFDYTKIAVTFRPGSFGDYDEERLAHQLTRLGSTTFVSYHRGRMEAYAKSQGISAEQAADLVKTAPDEKRRTYEEELNRIEATGVSMGREIRIRTRGMTQWKVDIKPGAVQRLDEERFMAELNSAIQAWQADRENRIITLKSDHFDIGIPKRWKQIMDELRAINERKR